MRDIDDAWVPGEETAVFRLDPANPDLRGLTPGKTYMVVGHLERASLKQPNPATDWMRDRRWSFNGGTEASVRGQSPTMFPTLNLAVMAALMEAGVDRATPQSARTMTAVTGLVTVKR